MVGNDDDFVIVSLGSFYGILHTFVDSNYGLFDSRIDTGVTYHVTVGIVHHNEIVLLSTDSFHQLVLHFVSTHFRLQVVSSYLWRRNEDTVFVVVWSFTTTVEEEGYALDIIVGKGPSARNIRFSLKKFTLIGATTRVGMLAAPLRDRFGIVNRLEMYTPSELQEIVTRSARALDIAIADEAASEIARRSRGTPRIANRLLKRVRDFSMVKGNTEITREDARFALARQEIDELGLDETDRNLLRALIEKFGGGPTGLETLAATINEDANTIEDVYEPYLLQLGFIARTPRGRICLKDGYIHMGMQPSAKARRQMSVFDLDD